MIEKTYKLFLLAYMSPVEGGGMEFVMKKNVIPIALLFGVAFGNAIGAILLIWSINMGLLIGNAIGISLGLVAGLIYDYLQKKGQKRSHFHVSFSAWIYYRNFVKNISFFVS